MFWLQNVRRLDMYRKVPTDMTEQSVSGGLVSALSILFMLFLFWGELSAFWSTETASEMFVDQTHEDEQLQINVDLVFPAVPCAIISLDAQDIMGNHRVDVGGALHKKRVDNQGHEKLNSEESLEDITKQKGEGCNIFGNIVVEKVPGNFHISAHAHADLLPYLFDEEHPVLNVSHTIRHLSFGDPKQLKTIPGNVTPLNGVSKLTPRNLATTRTRQGRVSITYEYFIKIVPTSYEALRTEPVYGNQFTAHFNEMKGNHFLPAVYFRYDMSPITVKFTQKSTSFSHFLVQLCAIIGGVFTVLGMIDTVIDKSVRVIAQKARLGKLG